MAGHDATNSRPASAAASRLVFGSSLFVFAFMLLFGFAIHPNIFSFSMASDVNSWTVEWRTKEWFQIGRFHVGR